MPKLYRKMFSGAANVHNGVLADILISLAGGIAKNAAAPVADITDNSGGVAPDNTVALVPLAKATPAAADVCPTKAEIETDFGQVRDAYSEIARQIGLIAAKVPAFTPVNNIGGTAPDGTIGAITTAITGGTPRVAKAGFNAVTTRLVNLLGQLIIDVNALAVATGQTALIDNTNGSPVFSHTYAAVSVDTGTAAADGTTSVASADATATLVAFANSIKELSTKLNAITSDTPAAPSVIVA